MSIRYKVRLTIDHKGFVPGSGGLAVVQAVVRRGAHRSGFGAPVHAIGASVRIPGDTHDALLGERLALKRLVEELHRTVVDHGTRYGLPPVFVEQDAQEVVAAVWDAWRSTQNPRDRFGGGGEQDTLKGHPKERTYTRTVWVSP